MDPITLFSIISIFILALILFYTLAQSETKAPKSAGDKKREIIDNYKKQLKNALLPFQGDAEAIKRKKSELLKEISNELARNIFFDQDEMRIVIQELIQYDYKEVQ
jgi:hypothetical protein